MSGFRTTTRITGGSGGGVMGRLAGSVFFLVFAVMGTVVGVLFARALLRGMAAWHWEPTQCRVLASGVDDLLFSLPPEEAAREGDPFKLRVSYQWEWQGRTFGGDKVGAHGQYGTRDAARQAAARYPAGGMVRCFVDPDDASQAALRRPALWVLLFLLLPLTFVLFGIGGAVGIWLRRRKPAAGTAAPRSRRTSSGGGRGCAVAAFGVFALFGAGFMIPFALPVAHRLASTRWQQVPATIVWSGVGAHSGDESATYSVDVLYEYDYGGERFRSNHYRFMGGSSSGSEAKQAAVDRMPPGTRTVCWIDPRDPSRAVLDRGLGGFIWFSSIPGVFLAIGLVGMIVSLLAGRGPKPAADWLPGDASVDAGAAAAPMAALAGGGTVRELAVEAPGSSRGAGPPAGPLHVQAAKSRLGSFVVLAVFTLLWNGFVGFVLAMLFREGKLGSDGCVTAFIGVFVLAGLVLLSALPYQFLGLFNPRPEVTLSAPLVPGSPVALSWRFSGAAGRLTSLVLQVEGSEQATYRVGTQSSTDKRVFARLVLVETSDPGRIAAGETMLLLPADTMHSFKASHNEIVWTLKVRGDIARWPDLDDELALTVYPASFLGHSEVTA